jgi:hypothetical protein
VAIVEAEGGGEYRETCLVLTIATAATVSL